MFAPGWKAGCPSCSFWADNLGGFRFHLPHRDITFKAISRASLEEIQAYRKRMGWEFDWVSSADSEFNFDVGTSSKLPPAKQYPREEFREGVESPCLSAFYRNGNDVYHTYFSTYRSLEALNTVYGALDLVPKGRDEANVKPWPMAWVRNTTIINSPFWVSVPNCGPCPRGHLQRTMPLSGPSPPQNATSIGQVGKETFPN
jgi:predicted dithiol-disulfide oxidoreductase (DUF899 family)